MDKDTLALYVEYEKGLDKVDITDYEKQWSPPENQYYLIIKYINMDIVSHKFTMIEQYISTFMIYRKWEQQYLRRFKLNKLMKKIKNGI